MIELQTTGSPAASAGALAPAAAACSMEQVMLRHLATQDEIASVLHLREEIDLSALALSGLQEFERLEKKETSWGSSSASTSTASGSARSASSPSAAG